MKIILSKSKGFTLIEIVVVAVIMGILGMMAIPSALKMMNRSYGQDAMHNLIAIYAAQQNYAQNHGGVFLSCTSITPLADCINQTDDSTAAPPTSGLGLSIVSSGGMTYSCDAASSSCSAVASASTGGFTMSLTLNTAISLNSSPIYCDGSANPCCDMTASSVAGATCP